jgi:uncharacterized protein YukE
MDARWVPVLAAIVGVLGGMGGALIGGYVANEGQQQRFEDERAAHVQDLRRGTYAEYVRELNNAILIGGNPAKAFNAQAEVSILSSSSAVKNAARQLGKAADELNEAIAKLAQTKEGRLKERYAQEERRLSRVYARKLNRFIDRAREEIETGE